MPSQQAFEEGIDEVIEYLDQIGIDYEQRDHTADDEDVAIIVFYFVDDSETDYFLGFRDDNDYSELIWEFNLLPPISQQITDDHAEQIISSEELPEDPDAVEETAEALLLLLNKHKEGEFMQAIEGTNLEERVEESSVEEVISEIQSWFHHVIAAERALDRLTEEKTANILLNVENILKDLPADFSIKQSEESGIRGFKIQQPVFHYEDQFGVQSLYEKYSSVWNHGLYTERFLKDTFNIKDSEVLRRPAEKSRSQEPESDQSIFDISMPN